MDLQKYRTKLPYAHRDKSPDVHAAYMEDQKRLDSVFKVDALEEVGLTGHPKAERAFSFAWEQGRFSGLADVLYRLKGIAEILKD